MHENVGKVDRIVRIAAAAICAVVAVVEAAELPIAGPAALAAVWFAGTAITRRCLVYHVLHLSTTRGPHSPPRGSP